MKNLLHLGLMIGLLLLFACAKSPDDPLTLPPNFTEMPDPKNPEKIIPENQEENVAKLKELLLESE